MRDRRRRIALGVVAAALLAMPLLGAGFSLDLITKVLILSIFAMSLDLLVGHTGLISFGHAAFSGIGSYALVLASPRYDPASLWWTLPLAMAAAGAAACVVGLLVVRTKGIYFIMATLAFSQMFFFLAHDTELGGGSDGVSINFKPVARVAGHTLIDLASPFQFYYLVLGCAALVYLFLWTLLRSPAGHAFEGIRQNEHRMRSLGFRVLRYKLASFTLGGTLAGLAGYLSAAQFGFVNPELFAWHQSGNVLLMVILGGAGSLHGAVEGAFAFVLLQELFQWATPHWQLLFGATIVLLVIFLPDGLAGIPRRLARVFPGGADE